MRLIYTLLLALVSPVFLYSLYKKKQDKPSFGSRWKEHWGVTPAIKGKNPIWIHAVSVGESIAAIPVIKALKKAQPDQAILVTTTTATGAEQIAKLGDLVEHRFMPLDFSWCVRRFIKTVQPTQLLIVETELWPNTLKTVFQSAIPITVINARLSERSYMRYRKRPAFFNLIKPYINRILCQYKSDAERFICLGFKPDQVEVTGSVKFDIEIPSSTQQASIELKQQFNDRPVWIAASTHEGEDAIILDAHQKLLNTFPNALLILVPRHPERFTPVFELCTKQNFVTERRTANSPIDQNCQVYLGDTMGEMLILLGAADICFMGGSLVGDKVGGHNLLEPAALGKPLLNGPSYFNFSEIMQMLQENEAVTICSNSEKITKCLIDLFTHPENLKQVGEKSRKVIDNNRGAIMKTITKIR